MASSPERAVAVLFDTNFLMSAARLHFDLFNSVEQVLDSPFDAKILATNLRELKTLAGGSGAVSKRQARVALKLAESCRVIQQTSSKRDPDDDILKFASDKRGIIVATNDAILRNKLRSTGCPVLFMTRSGELDLLGYEN
jgi:rRNA-processing protein FCF1